MKHITDLQDIGVSEKCIIVGGGVSVREFDFLDINDYYIICCNNHFSQMADLIVYYDKDMNEYFRNHFVSSDTLLAGFKHKGIDHTNNKCTHYYTYDDMVFGDTGFHCLQFADKVLNFREIYLVGYDYYTVGKTYHHDEKESNDTKMGRFKTWSIGEVLQKYNDVGWNNRIFNCNEESRLNVFEYGLPY